MKDDSMEQLYTVKINSEQFPSLEKYTKEIKIELITIENGLNMIELMIESNEPENVIEPEYQEPTYIVYVTFDGDTVDRLVHPYAFWKYGSKGNNFGISWAIYGLQWFFRNKSKRKLKKS